MWEAHMEQTCMYISYVWEYVRGRSTRYIQFEKFAKYVLLYVSSLQQPISYMLIRGGGK